MSYDISLKPVSCAACGRSDPEPDCPNPTYNLMEIFDLALTGEPLPNPETSEASVVLLGAKTDRPRGLGLLDGRKAKDTLPDIDLALIRMTAPTLTPLFTALEPENGWGDLPGAIRVMKMLKEIAEEHPENTWEIR